MPYLFNPEGLRSLIQALYQKPEAEFQAEIQQFSGNFVQWLKSQFDFTPAQKQYLQNIHPDVMSLLEKEINLALQHKLPIQLHKSQTSSMFAEEEKPGKIVWSENDMHIASNNGKLQQTKGVLHIYIDYEPILQLTKLN